MNPQDVVFLFLFLKFKVQRICTELNHKIEIHFLFLSGEQYSWLFNARVGMLTNLSGFSNLGLHCNLPVY